MMRVRLPVPHLKLLLQSCYQIIIGIHCGRIFGIFIPIILFFAGVIHIRAKAPLSVFFFLDLVDTTAAFSLSLASLSFSLWGSSSSTVIMWTVSSTSISSGKFDERAGEREEATTSSDDAFFLYLLRVV
jgi:hypothetical protein